MIFSHMWFDELHTQCLTFDCEKNVAPGHLLPITIIELKEVADRLSFSSILIRARSYKILNVIHDIISFRHLS